MREGLKVAFAVTLLALLGIDVGLNVAFIFGSCSVQLRPGLIGGTVALIADTKAVALTLIAGA